MKNALLIAFCGAVGLGGVIYLMKSQPGQVRKYTPVLTRPPEPLDPLKEFFGNFFPL